MTHFVLHVTRPTHFLPATHSYQQTQGRKQTPKCPGNMLDHLHIFQNSQGPCIVIFLLFSIFCCSRCKGVNRLRNARGICYNRWHMFQNSQAPCILIFVSFSCVSSSRRKGVNRLRNTQEICQIVGTYSKIHRPPVFCVCVCVCVCMYAQA